ncbi:MAG: MG2 domain-containing protein [Prolixibacteraceae bacterium]
MKTFYLLAILMTAGLVLSAQDQETIAKINRQLAGYYGSHPIQKVFVTTDKSIYKPGETVWFQTIVTDNNLIPSASGSNELFVKLYDAKGKSEIQQLFKIRNGSANCDIALPKALTKGFYFLCVFPSSTTNPEDISITGVNIDPNYNNQWLVKSSLKDSISISGQKNELYAEIRDLSGEIQKNSTVRFQLMNGAEMIEKGKLKTNDQGKLTIPFSFPTKTNGEPFLMELSANREESVSEIFLPSNLDAVQIQFYPEGGTLIPGTLSKIGFTAMNKWGMPVGVEGDLQNQNSQMIAQVRTIDKGLGMFTLNCAENQKYKLVISGKTGQNQTFDLPNPNPNGLSLSIVKFDPQFITANLVFADKQKHSIALTMTQGNNMSWAADLDINQGGRIKIPADSIPHGINRLSVFSTTGELLAERIVFVDKKQELKIEVLPEKNSMLTGENMKVKVRLMDEKNQPLSGKISISVSDQHLIDATKPEIDESLLISSELENPFSLISGALKGKITQSILMDVYLIANRIKNGKWSSVLNSNPSATLEENRNLKPESEKKMDAQLSALLAGYGQKNRLIVQNGLQDVNYYTNNEGLFPKAPKIYKENNTALENQRRMFESATSILEVIKTLKPYKIQNNMIVFIGSENSLNYQGGALIVLDGQMLGTDISQLSGINPSEVDHINVSTNAMDIQRYTGLNSVGLIEIFQKKATMTELAPASESNEKYDQGHRIPGIFPASPANAKRDTRTTLLWIPEQKVDVTGLFEFSLTSGAVYTDFVVEVQGISENGRAGIGKAMFRVIK